MSITLHYIIKSCLIRRGQGSTMQRYCQAAEIDLRRVWGWFGGLGIIHGVWVLPASWLRCSRSGRVVDEIQINRQGRETDRQAAEGVVRRHRFSLKHSIAPNSMSIQRSLSSYFHDSRAGWHIPSGRAVEHSRAFGVSPGIHAGRQSNSRSTRTCAVPWPLDSRTF